MNHVGRNRWDARTEWGGKQEWPAGGALRDPKGSVTYCTDSKESLQFLELGMKMIFGDLYVF